MKVEFSDSRISLSQRSYIITDSLRETSKALFYVFIGILFYLLLALFPIITTDVETALQFLKFWIPFSIVVFSVVMIWYYQRARKTYRLANNWNTDYLQQAYILTFDTTLPTGNSTGEKVFSLAKLIFPELRTDYVKFSPYYTDHIKYYFRKKLGRTQEQPLSKSLNYVTDNYSLDMAFKTMKGYFIVKDFGNGLVRHKDIQELIQLCQAKFKDKYRRTYVRRVVCVGRQYDQDFSDRDTLERKMTEIRANFGIDLLIDDGTGYSVLWVG